MLSSRLRKKALLRGILGCLLAAALAAGAGGCSEDEPAPYDFNGTWVAAYQVVVSNAGYIPVGMISTGTVLIDQEGTDFVVTLGTGFPLVGICDPRLKTFSATGKVGATQRNLSGQVQDKDTLSGTLTLTKAKERVILSWTMDLVRRSKTDSGDGSTNCSVAAPLQCARSGF